jgi:hypothetical protein
MSITIDNTIYNYLIVPNNDIQKHLVAFSSDIDTDTNNPITQIIAYVDKYPLTKTDIIIKDMGSGDPHGQLVGSGGVLLGFHGTWTTYYGVGGTGSRPELVSLAGTYKA